MGKLNGCIIAPCRRTDKPFEAAHGDKPVDKYKAKMIIGIDEVGRGPLAGPLAVGVFVIKSARKSVDEKQIAKLFRGVKESKQLSEARREEWFAVIETARNAGLVDFSVQFQSEKNIDSRGLTRTIDKAISSALRAVNASKNSLILLDGGLRAPAHFTNQKTIIRGDEKKIVIALASICAKVLRDRRMRAFAKKYPRYSFEIHKGYGTRAHIAAIRKHGPCPIHRRSFLRTVLAKI